MLNLTLYETQIIVNLETLNKYHKAVKPKLDTLKKSNKSTTEYLTSVKFVLGLIEKTEIIHPAYEYFHIPEDIISKQHSNNLLFLVQSFIDWEWRIFRETIIDTDITREFWIEADKNDQISINELLINSINDLKDLLKIQEARIADESRIEDANKKKKSNFQLNYTNNDKKHHLLNIRDSKVIEECEILLISHYFKKIKEFTYFMNLSANQRDLTKKLSEMQTPNLEILEKLEQTIDTNDTKISNAKNLFRKLVSQKIVQYLKSENIIPTPKGVGDGTKEQAEIVYPLLCIFNLIDKEQILRHPDSRERSKYIRSIFHNKNKRKDGSFNSDHFSEIEVEYLPDNL